MATGHAENGSGHPGSNASLSHLLWQVWTEAVDFACLVRCPFS